MKITPMIDRISEIPDNFRTPSLPIPPVVKIELTSRCNFKCWFCATGKHLRAKGDMPFGEFQRLARQVKEDGVEELGLFYLGESAIYPRLVDAIDYAKNICEFQHVFLTTNGTILSGPRIMAMMKAGLDSLKFSFNSANKEEFKEETQVDAFDAVVQMIKEARRIRDEYAYPCGIFASSILHSNTQEEKMRPILEELAPFLDEHYWLPLFTQAGVIKDERGELPIVGTTGRLGHPVEPLPCWSVFRKGQITHDSKLSACCFDHAGKFIMADLRRVSFSEGWNSLAFQELRKAQLSGDVRGTACEDCVAIGGE